MNDILATDSKGQPANSYNDLIENNPEVTEALIKQKALPVYKQHATKFIEDFMNREYGGKSTKKEFIKAYTVGTDDGPTGLEGLKKSKAFSELVTQLKLSYDGFFAPTEIENLALSTIENSFKN